MSTKIFTPKMLCSYYISHYWARTEGSWLQIKPANFRRPPKGHAGGLVFMRLINCA